MSGRILIVDDDRDMCDLLDADLRRRGFATTSFTSAEQAFARLGEEEVDVVLTDLNLPGMSGVELCERIVANRPDVPVIVLTAFGSLDAAVATIRAGAYDFVTKPVDTDLLVISLERALRHRAMQEQIRLLSREGGEDAGDGLLIGESRPMRELQRQIDRIADTDASVLVCGESGTGKELVARTLHGRSARRSRPFVAINCAALPEPLLESELFGHKRGAFTDARADRKGLILEADGGTLLLDEIGEMAIPLQPKLLRALEERRLRPVGGGREVPFDIRVISSTNRDLESAVEDGLFRKDLFYRLNVIQLHVPPLRSRGTDTLLLADRFLREFAGRFDKPVVGLSEPTAEKLLNYSWPGNVRELRNAMERAVALARYDRIAVEDLPEKIRDYQPSHVILGGSDPRELLPMEEVERRYILHVLDAAGGNRTLAARILGLDRKTLYRKLQRYGSEKG
jgi:DNA-binding NtrC family response regulator